GALERTNVSPHQHRGPLRREHDPGEMSRAAHDELAYRLSDRRPAETHPRSGKVALAEGLLERARLRTRDPHKRRPADEPVPPAHLGDELIVCRPSTAHRREIPREIGVALRCAVG